MCSRTNEFIEVSVGVPVDSVLSDADGAMVGDAVLADSEGAIVGGAVLSDADGDEVGL